MTKTQGLDAFCGKLVRKAAARRSDLLASRLIVSTAGRQDKIFEARRAGRPNTAFILIELGKQFMDAEDLEGMVHEVVLAAEAVLYGTTTASSIRLDAATRAWFDWEIRQREQGSE